jgi:cyclopropane-fatty-acyl-phospholipid synthase
MSIMFEDDRQDEPETTPVQGLPKPVPPSRGPVHKTERWLTERVLEMAGNPPLAIVLWDGTEIATGQQPVLGRLLVHDRRALRKLAINPDLELGDLYSAGRIDVEGDLAQILEIAYRAQAVAHTSSTMVLGLLPTLSRRPRNTLSRARENIHHHYDIGNDFYRLWLDEQLVYTCAYYPAQTETLEEAQQAKLDYVCRKLRLKPGDRVVDAGCGWGALALHMARHYGASVKAFNISHEQIAFARERARIEGLEDRVEFIEDDYRNMSGEYDAFASIGMLEHVGIANYGQLGELIQRVLTPAGRGLIHSIGRDYPMPINAWIDRRVFPGAQPPSIGEMMGLFETSGLSVLDVENLRLHYARTLDHWSERFEQSVDRVREMFDESFVRVWRMYLASSIAAFRSGTLQLFQVIFTHSGNNDIPWTRRYLCRDGE